MIDWSQVKNKAIEERVKEEGRVLMSHAHFGVQGIEKTEDDVKAALARLQATGYKPMAFDTEMNFVSMIRDLVGDIYNLHCAVSYPLGRMTLKKKMQDLETLLKMDIKDVCVCLDWQALFSHRYKDVEKEAAAIVKEFDGVFTKNAYVIPATLLSDTEMKDTLAALDAAGVYSIKVNPGCKLGVSYEEVELIKRLYPNRFDIHPSGNIRTLEAFEKFMELGCEVIHTASALDITEAYMKRQLEIYGGLKECH